MRRLRGHRGLAGLASLAGLAGLHLLVGLCAVGGTVGCASLEATSVVSPRDLAEAAGRPRIEEIRDIGGSDIPEIGLLRMGASDGAAVVGETLWVRGNEFGRQPTVTLGGRSVTVVSRTGDGGILIRVPVGTPAGKQPLVVSQEEGQHERLIDVRRLAAVLAPDRVAWLKLEGQGPVFLDGTPLPGARHLQLSADARGAYVVDGQGTLHVFELPAAGVPAPAGKQEVGPGVRGLFAASTAHRLIVLRERDLLLLDSSSPLRPVRESERALPGWLQVGEGQTGQAARDGIVKVTASPDARLLAVAVGRKNRVVVFDVEHLRALPAPAPLTDPPMAEVALHPEVLGTVLIDIAFSPDGRTLWALSGSSERNRSLGPQPTTVTALRLRRSDAGGDTLVLHAARTVALKEVALPIAIGTGRSLPLASGSAVRLPPEKATVYLSGRTAGEQNPAIFAVGAEDTAVPLAVESGASAVGRTDVTPDGRWVLGTFVDAAGALTVVSAPADGRPGEPRSLVVAPRVAAQALSGAELRLQP